MITTADLQSMTKDDRWEGFGFLGARQAAYASVESGEWPASHLGFVMDVDFVVLQLANEAGLDAEEFFGWANSKAGRHFGDVVYGASYGRLDASIAEATKFGLTPKAVRS